MIDSFFRENRHNDWYDDDGGRFEVRQETVAEEKAYPAGKKSEQ